MIVAIFNLTIGFIVLLGGNRKLSSYVFFLLCFAVFGWSIGVALFLSASTISLALPAAQMYYSAAAIIGYALLSFAISYAFDRVHWKILLLLLFPVILVVGSIFTENNSLIQAVTINSDGNMVKLNKDPYYLYSYYFLSYMYIGITLTAIKMFRKTTSAKTKDQLKYIFLSLFLAGTLGAIFNLLLPLFNNYRLIWVGPLFSLVMVVLIFTAIVKHSLFDVRQAIARTVAYALLLISMATIYGLSIFTIATLFFDADGASGIQYGINILFAVILAFSYQPLKRFFDKITNKLFFRARYDLEKALDAVSEAVVKTATMKELINDIYSILSETLHPQFLQIIAVNEKKEIVHRKASNDVHIGLGMLESKLGGSDVFFTKRNEVVDIYLNDKHISAVALLRTSDEIVGYVVMGEKRSGGYDSNDERLLTVLSDELAVAFQNILRFEKIQLFNETLQKNIEEATGELRTSNKKLKALDESKDEFISMASHQLRTPLTSIKGYLSMVLEGDVGTVTDEQRKLLEEAYNSSQRMVYLIGDFLNVSRLQTGKFELERSQVQLPLLINDEIAQLRATALARKINVEYQPPDSFPVLSLDENKIRQVMMNFIDNAIYYAKPGGGTVAITLSKHAAHISFKVTDDGIGVPKHERHQLFTKFYRASNAKKARPDGTGIGLFMAKKVIVAHGGAILFESTEGKGSTFGFRLPIVSTE